MSDYKCKAPVAIHEITDYRDFKLYIAYRGETKHAYT